MWGYVGGEYSAMRRQVFFGGGGNVWLLYSENWSPCETLGHIYGHQTKNCNSSQDHHHSSLIFTRHKTWHMKTLNVFLCEISDFRRNAVEACHFPTCYVTWSDTKLKPRNIPEEWSLKRYPHIYIQDHKLSLFLSFVINIILQYSYTSHPSLSKHYKIFVEV